MVRQRKEKQTRFAFIVFSTLHSRFSSPSLLSFVEKERERSREMNRCSMKHTVHGEIKKRFGRRKGFVRCLGSFGCAKQVTERQMYFLFFSSCWAFCRLPCGREKSKREPPSRSLGNQKRNTEQQNNHLRKKFPSAFKKVKGKGSVAMVNQYTIYIGFCH